MSARATFWAWDIRDLPSPEKLSLLCLCDCHNDDTNRCDPSVKHISDKTGLDRKTVMSALSRIEERGLILSFKRNGARTSYAMCFEATSTELGTDQKKGKDPISSTKKGTGTENTTGTEYGPAPVPNTGPPPVPNTVPEPITKPKTESKTNIQGLNRVAFDEFLDYRKKIKRPIKDVSIEKLAKQFAKHDFEVQQAGVDKSISLGYQGVFFDEQKPAMTQQAANQSQQTNSDRMIKERERIMAGVQ